eukprot:CAMPEP_0116847582 /NCGR_PEP_ID=MMETSP0418-20121206/14515_1 /TAXON_ID=1158023 /ORGANISM="Astrosyne radiata, Strain 13vi08-1A" /LENGTH=85 /DNA_ID=CAMNT_0004479045 /DNA_START=60 /DNA_END=317 /DNA_ORIENTATION=+
MKSVRFAKEMETVHTFEKVEGYADLFYTVQDCERFRHERRLEKQAANMRRATAYSKRQCKTPPPFFIQRQQYQQHTPRHGFALAA